MVPPPSDSLDDAPDDGDTTDVSTSETADPVTVESTIADAPAARRKSAQLDAAVIAEARGRTIHQQSTQQLPVARVPGTAGGSQSDETSIRSSTVSTPIEALHLEEVERTRIFLRICFLIVVAVAGALQVLGGDPTAKNLVYLGLGLASLTMGWLYYDIRDPTRYQVRKVLVVGYSLIVAAYLGVYYFGVFSPGPTIVVMGIYFFSLGGSLRATVAIYVTCAAVLAVLAACIAVGAIPDRGLVTADRLEPAQMIITQGVVQVIFLCTYLIARSSRKATLDAIDKLQSAMRAVGAREALLLEARQDLDRALEVGGPGRFTGQKLGSYQLGFLIGRGGMGEVYSATDADGGAPAAIKLLHPHAMANPDQVTRFERETEAAAQLSSENVVRVLEVGRTDGDVPYLAMERLDGHDLAYHLRQRRRLAPSKVVVLIRQVAAGLEEARAAGIVHRDIKPQNLFLADQDGRQVWKILDFGVSKLAASGGTLTRGHVVGTPGYMAPEQAQAKAVDYRADLYALAAIAYRALTGRPPFSGKDVPTTLYKVVYKMPKRPSDLVSLHSDVDAVLALGMAKRPDDRFESGAAFADALHAAIRGELDPELRLRAQALGREFPWGVVI